MTGVLRSSFARHETFHPRYGWLRKAYDAAHRGPDEFLRADATTRLGVGKNMVRAIRYWGVAFKVIEEVRSEVNPRLTAVVVSEFGDRLLDERHGWDPYLEEPGSLWLLHWQLLRAVPECRAPAWWAIFNAPRMLEFAEPELTAELRRFRDEHADFAAIVNPSLEKDVRCLLRMYATVSRGRDAPEDSIDSPFAELELVRPAPGGGYQLNRGPKPTLPDAVVAWACLDYARTEDVRARTLGLATLVGAAGSPGRAFGLSESALGDALARVPEAKLTDVAGLRQLVVPAERDAAADALLERFYAAV
jgi:hypothetical protein